MILQKDILLNKRYKLIERIGSGGFSVVWKALDIQTGDAQVAIKIFLPDKGMDTNGLAVFQEEYQLTHGLNDGRLVKNTDFFIEDYSPCLVMPYMPNGSLYGKITKHGPLSEDEVAKVLYQVSGGLHYLHSQAQPVLHLDIKPDNILIDYSGDYRLADFGISTRTRSSLLRASNQKGETLAYGTPERALSKKVGPYSDIFSLGITIFELCTGEVPWNAEGGKALVLGLPLPELPENFSRRLNDIMQACLSLEPADRLTAKELERLSAFYLDKKYWEVLPAKKYLSGPLLKGELMDDSSKGKILIETKQIQTETKKKQGFIKQNRPDTVTLLEKAFFVVITITMVIICIIGSCKKLKSYSNSEWAVPSVYEDTIATPADTTAPDTNAVW